METNFPSRNLYSNWRRGHKNIYYTVCYKIISAIEITKKIELGKRNKKCWERSEIIKWLVSISLTEMAFEQRLMR